MNGNITQRGPTTFRLRVFAGRDPVSKRPRWISETFHGTKREAQRQLSRLITEVSDGRREGAGATLGVLLDRWLELLERRDYSPATLREYHRLITKELQPALGEIPLAKLTALQLDRTYDGWSRQGLAANSIRNRHRIISAACEQGVKWGWLRNNPASRSTPPPARTPAVVPPTPADVRRLIDDAQLRNPDIGAFLWLAALLGARRGELCALRWQDIDLQTGTVCIAHSLDYPRGDSAWALKPTKTHSVRTLGIDATCSRILAEHRARCTERSPSRSLRPEHFLFSTSIDGTAPLHPDSVSQFVGRRCRALNLPNLHLHSLRHWMVTTALSGGSDVRTVAGRAGHRDASVTLKVYGHFLEAPDRATADHLGNVLSVETNSDEKRMLA
jgi:integrase